MRTTLVIMLMGLSMAAEQPKPKPDAVKSEPPKQATVDALQLENLELKMALNKRAEQDIQTAYGALIATACQSIGGKVADDCIPLPRQAGQPMTVQLKPAAKAEVKK